MTRIAVIGAGLSGLVVARRLQGPADVDVFEKSRGPGGRIATRYAGEYEFDHGAPCFTASSEAFRTFLKPLLDAGVVAEWQADVAEYDGSKMTSLCAWRDAPPRYVGAPRMNRIGKALSADLGICLEATITAIARTSDGWMLTDAKGTNAGPYDWIVLTPPAEQTATLADAFPDLVRFCSNRRMSGCFTLMLGFAEAIDLGWQAARIVNTDIAWMAVNSSKPGRESPFTLVVHSATTWADAHMDSDADFVVKHMLEEASAVAGRDLRLAGHRQLHRWRYAHAAERTGPSYFLNPDARLAACGDWCIRGEVEQAFVSANELANALAERARR